QFVLGHGGGRGGSGESRARRRRVPRAGAGRDGKGKGRRHADRTRGCRHSRRPRERGRGGRSVVDAAVPRGGVAPPSPAGLTRGSIVLRKTFLRRGWIAGSKPGNDRVKGVRGKVKVRGEDDGVLASEDRA